MADNIVTFDGIKIRSDLNTSVELLNRISAFREKHYNGITPIDNDDVIAKMATATLSASQAGTKALSISNVEASKWGYVGIPGLNELNYRPMGTPSILLGVTDNYFYGMTHSIHNSCTLRKFNESGVVESVSLPFSAASSNYAMARVVYEGGKFTVYAVKSCLDETDTPIEVDSFAIEDYFTDAEYIAPVLGLINNANKTLTIYDQFEVASKFEMQKEKALQEATEYSSNIFNIQKVTNDDLSILSNKDASTTIDASGNVTVTVANPENHWIAVEFAKRNIRISAEYVAIATGTSMVSGNPQQDVVLAICCNAGSNCGKLFVFRYGYLDFEADTTSIGTITKGNYPHFVMKSQYVVSVQLDNGEYVDVDIRTCKHTIAARQISWNGLMLGAVVNEANTTAIRVDNSLINPFNDGWHQKQWFAFGDSITYMGYYLASCANKLGCKYSKYGHGGYSYAQLANVYTEMIGTGTTPDVVTLFAGTNDFGHSGTIEAMQNGMRTILDGLYEAFPKVTIAIITPLQRNFDASGTAGETSGLGPNALGKYLVDYVDAIIEIAAEYGIPVLDFYRRGGINVLNASVKTSDGLHPTSEYGVVLGNEIAEFINGLYPFE